MRRRRAHRALLPGPAGIPFDRDLRNRDCKGSTHFFFDNGHGNALAFFDLPGLNLDPYAEVLGGLHHLAISVVPPERWTNLNDKLDVADIAYLIESDTSLYFRDPDGTRLELIADPLGEMYGMQLMRPEQSGSRGALPSQEGGNYDA